MTDCDIFISYIGFFSSSGDFDWKQSSTKYVVHFIDKGEGVFEKGGKKYRVGAGGTFAFIPGEFRVVSSKVEIEFWSL